MDERELRDMVRDAVERHFGRRAGAAQMPSFAGHASHVILQLSTGGDRDDGACLIEPAVRCNHCGYCVSYGH
jgi:hypothetical protein